MSSEKKPVDTDEIDATVVLAGNARQNTTRTEPAEESRAEVPESSRQFRFLCNFAAGGVGCVGKARDLFFDRIVAVKSLNEKFRDDPRAIEAFLEECRLNARLDHPSIVPVYAMGKDSAGHWEVMMKLINGTSLAQFIKAAREAYLHKQVSSRQEQHALISRLEYFLKVCEVVSYSHSQGIMHGDIKPGNIMMGEFGEVYLMDWGSAQALDTVPEHLSGTPNYLPPEFLRDRRTTPQVDIFSLGMVLFEIVTLRRSSSGNVSEEGSAPPGTSATVTRSDIRDSDSYRHYLPELKISNTVKAIIYKAIHPDPAQRYASVSALASDVRHFIYDEEVSAAPDGPVRKFSRVVYRNRIKSLLILGALFALLGLWLFYSYYRASEQEQLRSRALAQHLKFQSYTDQLAAAVEKKFLLAQAQLLLFADNLIEDMAEPYRSTSAFYDNDRFRSAETSPPGMQSSDYYPNPVNLRYMVRIPAEHPSAVRLELLGAKQYVEICNKIIRYDLSSHNINMPTREIHQLLFSAQNQVQRLFVAWADGVRYSYPGTYEDPASSAFSQCWSKLKETAGSQAITWSKPYRGVLDRHRINCRYPLYTTAKEFLGIAGLELRLEETFEPLVRAHRADPVHELYFVGRHNQVVAITGDGLFLANEDGRLPGGPPVQPLVRFANRLRRNRYQQFEADFNGKHYYVSGAPIQTVGGTLVQMIEENAFRTHRHHYENEN